MNLLGAILYDPSTAANKATTAAAVMAVCDATNLALAITVPAHGKVLVKMRVAIDGAATWPQILLGVMNHTGGAVLGRVAPLVSMGGTALATTRAVAVAEFLMTGLTPGALTLDAAFGVELAVASTAIRWGGPNNTTASDAWGAFCFEAWDPQPNPTNFSSLSVDANGRVDVIKVAGTSQTARDLGAQLDAAVSSRMATYTQPTGFLAATFPTTVASTTNITAATGIDVTKWNGGAVPAPNVTGVPLVDLKYTLGTISPATAGSVRADAVTGAVGSVTGNVGGNVVGSVASVTAGVTLAASAITAIWDKLTSALTTVGSIGKLLVDQLDATISSRLPTSGYTAPLDAAGTRSAVGLASANLDTQLTALDNDILTRLAASSYTAPLSAAGTRTAIGMASADLDTQLGTLNTNVLARLATASYTAPDNAGISAIKTQTDKLTFTVANQIDANIQYVNDVQVTGNGTVATPWGP